MSYLLIKSLHTIAALATISGFVLRGYWMMNRSDRLNMRLTRITPHVVDTLFLLSGIALVLILQLNVLETPWLLAKFGGLIAYIVFGTVALKRGPTMQIRVFAFVAAIAAFTYMVGVALTKSPNSWITHL